MDNNYNSYNNFIKEHKNLIEKYNIMLELYEKEKLKKEGVDEKQSEIKKKVKKVVKINIDIPSNFNFNEDIKLDKKIRKYLNIDSKRISYMKLRRHLFDFIKTKELFIDEKIKLPTKIKIKLEFNGRYVDFNDFDKLVYVVIQK
jgi:hypothetical protein